VSLGRDYLSGDAGPTFAISGSAPTRVGAELSRREYVVLRSNPGGTPADGTANGNTVTLVATGKRVTLRTITILEVNANPATGNRHFRMAVYDGDGVDRGTFGGFRPFGGEGIPGGGTLAEAYQYDGEAGETIEIDRTGANGLQVQLTGYANGGHFAVLIGYSPG
jgi:hypothetical protein